MGDKSHKMASTLKHLIGGLELPIGAAEREGLNPLIVDLLKEAQDQARRDLQRISETSAPVT